MSSYESCLTLGKLPTRSPSHNYYLSAAAKPYAEVCVPRKCSSFHKLSSSGDSRRSRRRAGEVRKRRSYRGNFLGHSVGQGRRLGRKEGSSEEAFLCG